MPPKKSAKLAQPASFKPAMLNTSKRTNPSSSGAPVASSSSSKIASKQAKQTKLAYRPPTKSSKSASPRKSAATAGRSGPSYASKQNKAKGKARYIEDEADSGAEESDLSVVDGEEDEDDEGDDSDDFFSSDEEFAANVSGSMYDPNLSTSGARGKKRGKTSMPSESQQLKKWRKLSAEEREAVSSEGGIVWREARALISGLPKAAQQLISAALFKALARTDALLDKALFPREPRMPTIAGTGAGGRTRGGMTASGAGGEVQSSMISWRVEELGELNNGGLGGRTEDEPSGAGFGGDIADLEAMLLPEAEQQVELSRTLDLQDAALTKAKARLARARRDAAAAAKASAANLDASQAEAEAQANFNKLASIFKAAQEPTATAQAENDPRGDL